MATGELITVVVIDDHPAIVAGVEYWYRTAEPPVRVVATGSTAMAALVAPGDSADVVVFDLQLSSQGMPSYGELRRLVDAGRQVIVYTMRDNEQAALACLDIGAFTFLTKAEGKEHLVAATVAAAKNLPYTPPALAGALGANPESGPAAAVRTRGERAGRVVPVRVERTGGREVGYYRADGQHLP